MVFFLKCLSQLILVVSGIVGLLSKPYTERNGKKRVSPAGWILVSCILTGFVLFVITDVLQSVKNKAFASEQEARYQAEIQLAQSDIENHFIRELEVRWDASPDQLREIENVLASLPNPEAYNWIRAGIVAERADDNEWRFFMLGVQERIEPWSGSTKTPGFEDLAKVVDHTILHGLALQRGSRSAATELLDGRAETTRLTIGRNGVITAITYGNYLTYSLFEKGEIYLTCGKEYSYRNGYLPKSITLISHDPKLQLDQQLSLDWEYARKRTIEEEEQTVAKPLTPSPQSGPHMLQSTFSWTTENG